MNGTISYIQLANYTNYGKILIQKSLFHSERLSSVDKAALLIHEAFYSYLRKQYGDKDSVRARKIVGLLFSKLDQDKLSQEVSLLLKRKETNRPRQPSQPTVDIIQKFLSVGQSYHTEFKGGVYDQSQIGPDTLRLISKADRKLKIELYGNGYAPMPTKADMCTYNGNKGSGLTGSVSIDLEELGSSGWIGHKEVNLELRNKSVCSASVSYQITYNIAKQTPMWKWSTIANAPDGTLIAPQIGSYANIEISWPLMSQKEIKGGGWFNPERCQEIITDCSQIQYQTSSTWIYIGQ